MWLCLLLKLGLPEQAVGWFPLRFGLVVEDKPTEFSCINLYHFLRMNDAVQYTYIHMCKWGGVLWNGYILIGHHQQLVRHYIRLCIV